MLEAPTFTEFIFWWEKEKLEERIGHSNHSLEQKNPYPPACPSCHGQIVINEDLFDCLSSVFL